MMRSLVALWGELNDYLISHPLAAVLLGALIPVAGAIALYVLQYLRLLFSKTAIVGDWYEYHWSFFGGEPEFRKERWKIRKRFYLGYVVDAVSVSEGQGRELRYRGSLAIERDHWLVQFKSLTHDEFVFCRVTRPLPRKNLIMIGLQSCLDFNGRASVGPLVLTSKPVADAEAMALMSESIEINASAGLMRIMDMVPRAHAPG